MAGEWRKTTLDGLLSFSNGRSSPERSDELPFPVYGSNGIIGRAAETNASNETIIIGRVGSYCGSLYFSKEPCWVTDNAIRAEAIGGNSPRFLFYLLSSLDLNHWRAGSGQPLLNQQILSGIHVEAPEPNEQRAIAHILGTLDDKIELNRRMNQTLEAMARALFKSWFVNFDPVRAKAQGSYPSLPKPIADLFPDSFVDSELGEIPKGWKVGTIGDVVARRTERCVPSEETANVPYVPIDCISPNSLFLGESRPGTEAQSSLTRFYKHDILFGAMRPYFHKVCLAPFDGTTRTTAFVFFPKIKDNYSFVSLLIHQPDTIEYATRHSTGSTIPYAVWEGSLEAMPVVLPPDQLRASFNQRVLPLLLRIAKQYFEHSTLASLRDTLLPKLISGEIRVPDAGRVLNKSGL